MKKYEKIVKEIKEKIYSNTYQAGEVIPSENELVKIYRVSRSTVRQALKILSDSGLIQRRHGYGSTVIDRTILSFPVNGLTSYKEMKELLNFESSTDVVKFEKIKINDEIAKITLLPENELAYLILRRREINGIFSILDKDIFLCEVAKGLTRKIAEDSIYDYLENTLNLNISYAQKEITVESAKDIDRKYLSINPSEKQIVSVSSHVFLSDNTCFQYTESHHLANKFKFTEFSRRKN
ncbi:MULTISPECIES: trehalose operon repressor [unclassified Lactococcus]|uniref:trehalose operon repressor n=1 Tax=unclassified Lactococcus TaxID=2643510 RepID=UPI0011CA44D3|nr:MULTISPECIES: trehalose operon repressor [unclassified Lactococcus]MQW24065.1 trehalose operon repressor [Lactococcus sp. dk101]TXK36475.1 trehalose operon repressor [Lactococcus sp. dk310]TXK47173.1 trehalose operon repressor [Lactococcus sp. dk322]